MRKQGFESGWSLKSWMARDGQTCAKQILQRQKYIWRDFWHMLRVRTYVMACAVPIRCASRVRVKEEGLAFALPLIVDDMLDLRPLMAPLLANFSVLAFPFASPRCLHQFVSFMITSLLYRRASISRQTSKIKESEEGKRRICWHKPRHHSRKPVHYGDPYLTC